MLTMPDGVHRLILSSHLPKLKKVQVPHPEDVPGPSEAGKPKERRGSPLGENPTRFARKKGRQKRILPTWWKFLVFAGEAVAHSAPFSRTVPLWLPATTAELQICISVTISGCPKHILSVTYLGREPSVLTIHLFRKCHPLTVVLFGILFKSLSHTHTTYICMYLLSVCLYPLLECEFCE